jgi:MATE family multidrug resistance protein
VPADIAIRPFDVTHRGVLAIAVPMTLAYLSTPIVGVVNLGAVGQVGDPAMVGGVAIGALLFNFIFSTFNFLRSGDRARRPGRRRATGRGLGMAGALSSR